MKRNTDLDFTKIIKLISSFVAHTTCMDCCKFFELPETAECGHTACHLCWRKRRSCKWCAAVINRSTIKDNALVQTVTNHVRKLCEVFEKTFDFKVDRFSIGNIKKILKNAVLNDESIYEITTVNHIKSIAQVHSHPSTKKTVSSPNVVVKQVAQVDWEAIEQLPEFDQFIDMQNVEYGSEATKALKRCLRRSQRLFSISISTESVEVISTAENLPSPDQAQNDTIKTIFSLKSNRVVKGDWDEIEKFSDIDDYDVKQIIKIGRDHTTNVTDWLESSHSYIKPSVCSELQDVKTVTSIAQIHSDTATKQFSRSPKVLKYNVAQNDWDKIEKLADVDEVSIDRINPETDITKYVSYSLINTEKCSTLAISSESKQNITKLNFNEVIQDDWDKIEQFSEDDTVNNKESKDIDGTNEYSTENPRRSLRKREFKYYAECHYYPLNIKRRRS